MSSSMEDSCMPIAVIGMGCRFPGDATSPDLLWELLVEGRSAWSEFPKDRINIDGFYHPSGERQGSICFKGGHFLRDDIAAYDAPFFSTTAHEAAAMDPQQRMLLEVSYEAFENAGIPIESLPGSATAVYCGSFVKDYEQICLRDPDDSPQYAATGNGIAIMSNRISWFYDLRGPSMTLDTGCSASLVGVHLACQSLRTGESTMAMAMGAGLILTPATMLPMTALNFLSPDGKCFAFDERANGYGRGEGIGAVILKPLAAALRDNDTIRAVIRGSGVNQDGRSPGITMPSKEAQALNIRAVYKAAGLGYDRTAYFEAHGTGTQAGDPTELGAISETFAETRGQEDRLYVGSVKTNIGHLEGCAGIAGLIKSVLMLENGLIPTNLYFENVNPRIPLNEWKIKVPKSLTVWPMDGLRRVSVNCFGFGGTNAHIILDDALNYMSERQISGNHSSVNLSPLSTPSTADSGIALDGSMIDDAFSPTKTTHLYVLTAHEQSGIDRLSKMYSEYFVKLNTKEISDNERLRLCSDLAYTLGVRRSNLPWKAFVVSSTPEDLGTQFLSGLSNPERSSQAPVIAFAFSGQGAQWARMGVELLQFQVFKESLEAADEYLQDLGCEWSLMLEILKSKEMSLIDTSRISQPLSTALQVALVELLEHWGVKPNCVVGHSSGEIAAAYALGAISRQDAWRASYHRGRLASAIKFLAPKLKGRMMAAALSSEKAEEYLSTLEDGAAIVACINSPESVTLSGDEAAILELEKMLKRDGIFARILKVENAYHSSHMKKIERHYLDSISDIQTHRARDGRKMFSSVTGKEIPPTDLSSTYWAQNLVSPVRFSDALTSLIQAKNSKPDVIIEIGPHSVLQGPIKQILDAKMNTKLKPTYFTTLSRGKDAVVTTSETIGHAWSLGCAVDLARINSRSEYNPQVLSNLPTYPWNHTKTYWHESHLGSAHRFRKWGRQDLIGAPTADSIKSEPRWRGFIRVSENPWVEDHQVQNTIIYPAAGMMCMALEAAQQLQDENSEVEGYEVCKMHIDRAMIIPASAHGLETALNAKIQHASVQHIDRELCFEFTIYSKPKGAEWVEHAHGLVRVRYQSNSQSVVKAENELLSNEAYRVKCAELNEVCSEAVAPRQLYETLETIGMKYGPTFQNIVSVVKKNNLSRTRIRIPDTASRMPAQYEYPHLIHPATLDAMFQTLFVAGNEAMVPSYLESMFISSQFPSGAGRELDGYSTALRHGLRDATGSIVMSDVSWDKPLLVVKNLHLTALSDKPAGGTESGFLPNHHKLCTQLKWREDVDATETTSLNEWLELLAFKKLDLNILEIYGNEALLMSPVLRVLETASESSPRVARYTVAGGDASAFEVWGKKMPEWSGHLSWTLFDVKEEVLNQGFKPKTFDLIITHFDNESSKASFIKLLNNDGYMLYINQSGVVEQSEKPAQIDLANYQIITDTGMTSTSSDQSLHSLSSPHLRTIKILHNEASFVPGTIVLSSSKINSLMCCEVALIMPDGPSAALQHLSIRIIDALLLKGAIATPVPFSESEQLAGKLCISLMEIDSPVTFNLSNDHFDAFRSLIRVAKGTLWISRGGHVDCTIPSASPAATLCKTIRSEDPQKLLYSLDLDPSADIDSNMTGRAIMYVFMKSFTTGTACEETEYAERDGKILIPRVQLQTQLSSRIERGDSKPRPQLVPFDQPGRTLQLEICAVGDLDSLCFNDDAELNHSLEPDELEIKVGAAGIRMDDVKTALGQSTNNTFGIGLSGTVVRTASAVSKYKVGDRVVTLAPGAFKTTVRTSSSMCQAIPANMSLETATSLASHSALAYHSLITIGRLEKGDVILIHGGASIWGQVAIQIANTMGVKVFTTFIDDGERDIIERCGKIDTGFVFNIGSSQLVTKVLQYTKGHGLDLVLNTLPNAQLGFTWSAMNAFARFVDLSSDGNAIASFSSNPNLQNMSYSRVDLEAIIKRNKPLARRSLSSAFEMVRNGEIVPVEGVKVMPVSQISDAFREVYKGGQVVVTMSVDDIVPVIPRDEHPLKLEAEATYVLVGGLGGLGRSLAGLMIRHGARHLAFFSRSGATTEGQKQFLHELANQGVTGKVYKCDISVKDQLQETIRQCGQEMPKIRGVIQGAAVVKDAIFENMTYEDWVSATRPKMQGSWNLHETVPSDLDFFVFLSSSAAAIGARGQANYASGNAFQDALACYRRGKGQAAVSLDLGPILGVGMVAEDEATASILKAGGFFGIREQDFHLIVSAAMTGYTEDGTPTPAQLILATGTGGLILQNNVSDPYWYREARFSHMAQLDLPPTSTSSSTASSASIPELLAASTSLFDAINVVLEGLTILLARSMNMQPGDLDTNKPANAYGVDSLVAVGTRNWIFRETGVDVSVFEVLSEVSIKELAGVIVGRSRFISGDMKEE